MLKAWKLRHSDAKADAIRLTSRQRDVIRWAAEGKTDWEIATILGLSEHSADKYMRQVRERLGASNRVHAVAKAIRAHLIN